MAGATGAQLYTALGWHSVGDGLGEPATESSTPTIHLFAEWPGAGTTAARAVGVPCHRRVAATRTGLVDPGLGSMAGLDAVLHRSLAASAADAAATSLAAAQAAPDRAAAPVQATSQALHQPPSQPPYRPPIQPPYRPAPASLDRAPPAPAPLSLAPLDRARLDLAPARRPVSGAHWVVYTGVDSLWALDPAALPGLETVLAATAARNGLTGFSCWAREDWTSAPRTSSSPGDDPRGTGSTGAGSPISGERPLGLVFEVFGRRHREEVQPVAAFLARGGLDR